MDDLAKKRLEKQGVGIHRIQALEHLENNKSPICINCLNFINLDPYSPRKDVWYNHVCRANPLPKKINPTTGNIDPYSINDFGSEYFEDHEFEYCRKCNNGKCKQYEVK